MKYQLLNTRAVVLSETKMLNENTQKDDRRTIQPSIIGASTKNV